MSVPRAFVALLLALSSPSCATLKLAPARPQAPQEDCTGVIHVHGAPSHDSDGAFEDIVAAARATRCDFVVLTDHDTLEWKPREGRRDDVLFVVGTELSLHGGHYLALGIDEVPVLREPRGPDGKRGKKRPPGAILQEVAAAGGVGIIAHPTAGSSDWENFGEPGCEPFAGLEIYNLAENLKEGAGVLRALQYVFVYPFAKKAVMASWLERQEATLARWDELGRSRRVVGIAGNDAHGSFGILGIDLVDYEMTFKIVRTHAIVEGPLTAESLLAAIRAGHCYVAFDLFADATGFRFEGTTGAPGGRRAILGDELAFDGDGGTLLEVETPAPARIDLLLDGKRVARTVGTRLLHRVRSPGVYRVEASLDDGGALWILSNPIYVRGVVP